MDHQKYMKRCIDLAKLGERRVAPNPMVGSVIVHKGMIIGEGYHQQYGDPHAEVNAINSVVNRKLLEESTLYVNLEPCSHYGKTPPCSNLIIDKHIQSVVVGTIDPFSKVAGKGIEMLKNAGCEVEVGVLLEDCQDLNRRFFTYHSKKRPYVILKWAQTADGFVDSDRSAENFGTPTWITNEMARIAVHKQRSTEQAIFIGTETALRDNPSLTLRDWYGIQPKRIIADRKQRLPLNLSLFDGKAETITLTSTAYRDDRKTIIVYTDPEGNVVEELLSHLYENEIQSVIIEGGTSMLQSFIDSGNWDEAHVYVGQLKFENGVKAPVFNETPVMYDRFYKSELLIYRNK